MPEDERAKIIHNTFTIIAANPAACKMFHCEEADLIDLDLVNIVADHDVQGLARLRLATLRNKHTLPKFDYPFWRPGGSKFVAMVESYRIDANTYESILTYRYEIP